MLTNYIFTKCSSFSLIKGAEHSCYSKHKCDKTGEGHAKMKLDFLAILRVPWGLLEMRALPFEKVQVLAQFLPYFKREQAQHVWVSCEKNWMQ